MTKLNKLQRDHATAELSALNSMIAAMGSDEDLISRISLEQRRAELEEQIKLIDTNGRILEDNFATAELIFGGRPVIASRGIDSEFGGRAVTQFQDLVSKQFALETGVNLASRGVVPNKGAARLYISDILRGSFGFRFEEIGEQFDSESTALKRAVDHAVGLIDAFAHLERELFEDVVETLDQRIVSSAEKFFELMHTEEATFRAITEDLDKNFDGDAISKALDRAKTTSIEDNEEQYIGSLLGILPDSHQFEFVIADSGKIIKGRVDKRLSSLELGKYLQEYLERQSVATVSVRRVRERGLTVRETFTLRLLENQFLQKK